MFGPDKSDEQVKREKIAQYFEPEKGPGPEPFGAAGLGGVVIVFVALWFGAPVFITLVFALAATVLFVVAFVMFNERSKRATDEDIDYWRDEDFDAAVAEVSADAALNAADLIDPDDPIVIAGLPRFSNLKVSHSHDDGNTPQAWRFKVKVGADGITRYTPPCLTVLHFTKDHLIAYQCDFDFLSGKPLNETIEEYFWQDIVTLQIEKQSLAADDDEKALYEQWSRHMPTKIAKKYAALKSDAPAVLPMGKRTTLRLKTTSGGGLEIVVGDERFVENPKDDDSLQARNARAILRLRKLLRDRKARR